MTILLEMSKFSQNIQRITLNHSYNVQEFYDVEAPFASLIFGDVGLGAQKKLGNLNLRHLRFSSGFNQKLPEVVVLFCMYRFFQVGMPMHLSLYFALRYDMRLE